MKILYLKDSNNRRKEFAVKTIIVLDNGNKLVIKEACFPEGKEHLKKIEKSQELFSKYYNNVKIAKTWIGDEKLYSEFIEGKSLLDYYTDAIKKNDKDKLKELIKFQFDLLLGNENNCVFKLTDEFNTIFGGIYNFICEPALTFTFFETDPANIIFKDNDFNNPYFIDYEWFYDIPIPVSLLGFRLIQQLSYIHGFDDVLSIEERAIVINCKLPINDGIVLINNFFSFVYIDKLINYSSINTNYGKAITSYYDFTAGYINKLCVLYFDTGSGFNESETSFFSFGDNEIEINCILPENTAAVRFDPIEKYGCIVSGLEILSGNGIAEYEPVNGYFDNKGNIVFNNNDPQILINNANKWVKIKYHIFISSDSSNHIILDNYMKFIQESNRLIDDYNTISKNHDELFLDRNAIAADREMLLNSRSWRITKPLRDLSDYIKRHKNLYFIVKIIFSIKRSGILRTIRNIDELKIKQEILSETSIRFKLAKNEELKQRKEIFNNQQKISIITPLYNTPKKLLKEMINSVRNQTYNNWELCLTDGSDNEHNYIKNICVKYSKKDNRIKYKKLEKNEGISENTNKAIEMSTGSYIGFLDHDDMLSLDALYEVAAAIQKTNADVFYSDEEHIDYYGKKYIYPYFKPDWSRDLLYSQMYICHLLVVKRDILFRTGLLNSDFNGSQDYDLMLRLSEQTESIYHIAKILYLWREVSSSTSINPDSKPYAKNAGINALNSHLSRRYNNACVGYTDNLFCLDTRFGNMNDKPLVSIIIPMRDKAELTDLCVQSIINKSTYSNWEILIINNDSKENATYEWFNKITRKDSRIKVYDANIEFNWSKINNIGIKKSKGDAYIFLNNDTIVITPDWIERLCENALRDEIGAVGPLLLYEDGTIQHAGVVVGMGGWADHVFKGMYPVHNCSPYVSPVINRNVLAVTGACMCVSKKTLEKIGLFNEEFIICGSDVELCLRAYKKGLRNLYNAQVRLYHLESKSRDSYIPEKDFEMSAKEYAPFRENNDPYFNINLDKNRPIPSILMNKNIIIKNFKLKNKNKSKITITNNNLAQDSIKPFENPVEISEVTPYSVRIDKDIKKTKRINLLIPSLNPAQVFGGIATALKFFQTLCEKIDASYRIIVTDAPVDINNIVSLDGYKIINCDQNSSEPKQIIAYNDRYNKSIPVGENDIFFGTAWWTAYCIYPVIKWQQNTFNNNNPLIYLIQDYEPGFYQWSSRYLLADSTYKSEIPVIAVFNTEILYNFFKEQKYSFYKEYFFNPVLNKKLAECLSKNNNQRRKQIIVYGRPSTPRNAFEIIVSSLKLWTSMQNNIEEWTIISVGERHPDIMLSKGKILKSIGKLTLEEYGKLMNETYMAISLMVSPHPSYPPLEMSTFGIRTITNSYANKNIGNFNKNIISLDTVNEENISNKLLALASEYPNGSDINYNNDYIDASDNIFNEICANISDILFNGDKKC